MSELTSQLLQDAQAASDRAREAELVTRAALLGELAMHFEPLTLDAVGSTVTEQSERTAENGQTVVSNMKKAVLDSIAAHRSQLESETFDEAEWPQVGPGHWSSMEVSIDDVLRALSRVQDPLAREIRQILSTYRYAVGRHTSPTRGFDLVPAEDIALHFQQALRNEMYALRDVRAADAAERKARKEHDQDVAKNMWEA